MRRNSIKAPGQVCEGGVTDMQDLQINCVGHAEALPTRIYHLPLLYLVSELTEALFTKSLLLLALFF